MYTEATFQPYYHAPNYTAFKQTCWKRWERFLQYHLLRHGHQLTPCDTTFKQYVLWRLNSTIRGQPPKSDSISVEISAINSLLWDKGHGVDRQHTLIGTKHLLGGVKRYQTEVEHRTVVDTRALLDVMLDRMLKHIKDLHSRAILLTMKHAALRSDNVVVNGNRHCLKIKNVHFWPALNNWRKVTITLPGSKTNQYRAHESRVIPCRCTESQGKLTCPAHTLFEVCAERQDKLKQPVFLRAPRKPFTKSHLDKLLADATQRIGLNPRCYTSKSLRIGQATDCMLKGVPPEKIMSDYNWKTRKVMLSYVRVKNPDFRRFDVVVPPSNTRSRKTKTKKSGKH